MIKFYKDYLLNFEINKEPTAIFFTYGCNLKCSTCCNKELLNKNPIKFNTKEEIVRYINNNNNIFNNIVFSGGEFLSNSIYELELFLGNINRVFKGKIIIYTNGFYPLKMKQLKKYVDGYHCDYKLPYHQIETSRDNFIIKKILGKTITEQQRINCIESIKYLSENKSKYDLVRTVKYPFLPDETLQEIKRFINIYKLPYIQTDFINVD